MKTIRGMLVFGIVLLMAIPVANGDIITTLFASNNGGNTGGAVYFDVTVGISPITITAFETNTSGTIPFNDFQVWVLSGLNGIGNEFNGSPWTMVATGSGTGAGLDLVTSVSLSNSFVLGSGLHGMALVAGTGLNHRYTNGTGGNQSYSNADLSLLLGTASNFPFTAPAFNPRVWNGSIIYAVAAVPEPASAFFGVGLLGMIWLKRRRD